MPDLKAGRRLACALAAAGAFLFGGGFDGARPGVPAAQAYIIYTLVPSVAVGATDNARVTTTSAPAGDAFGMLNIAAGAIKHGARVSYSLGYRLGFTHFLFGRGVGTLTNTLSAGANFILSARLELRLLASSSLSRTSRVDFGDPTVVMPQAAVAGSRLYLFTIVSQELVYNPSARWRYSELLSFAQLYYLGSGDPAAGATPGSRITLTAGQRLDYMLALDSFSLDARATDLIVGADHIILLQALLGWRRQLSMSWATELQGGALTVVRTSGGGDPVISPAAIASIGYTRMLWYAGLTVSRLPVPNMLVGAPTINNMVLARVSLPLTRDELLTIMGYGGFIRATLPASGTMAGGHAYDQWNAGVVLSARFRTLPLVASLAYTHLNQTGGGSGAIVFPSLQRRTILLSLTGTFSWGPGTPPIFGGGGGGGGGH